MTDRDDIKLVDASDVIRTLNEIARQFPQIASRLVQTIAYQILQMAIQLVPVYEGKPYLVERPGQGKVPHVGGFLRGTLYLRQVAPGVWEIGATAEYAAAQHEHPEFQHTHGEGKYLERPLLQFGMGDMPRHLAQQLLAELRKGM